MLGLDLQTLWFFILGALITGYAILDGFDLGVGLLQPFVRGDRERRLVLNSIGPLWDGNEVWLVTFGGALFAAFPIAYATFLSSFYLPFMVLLVSLIGRAISIEFRSKAKSKLWRSYWDYSFALSSFCVVFLFGVAAGNVMEGMPLVIGADGVVAFTGGLRDLLGPYALSVGVLAVLAAAMHGALYLQLKTEGELQARIHRWAWTAFGLFLVAYFGVTVATLVHMPNAIGNFLRWPALWGVVAFGVLAMANVPRSLFSDRPGEAFASSCITITALAFNFGMALFPNLIVSSLSPEASLTIYDAASSETTLRLMRNIAFLGMPLVLTYTTIVYWTFRGKTTLDDFSY
ncbi:MAG: cytochrome d ubiquinol oxidase subunit II [Myxococcota bacterium]